MPRVAMPADAVGLTSAETPAIARPAQGDPTGDA